MRYDKDLQFLAECRNEDLKTLADYLTHDAKGEIRMAEQLTDTDAYLCNYPDICGICGERLLTSFNGMEGTRL